MMRRQELQDDGAHFYKVDLQVHTPRDTNWNGPRPTTNQEREDFASDFIKAVRAKGLHGVAISDHHDFAFFPYIKHAADSETDSDGQPLPSKERIVVFPAIELTLSVPCQALLLLDADFPVARLDDVLKALHFEPIDPTLPSYPATQVLNDSGDINTLCEKLDKNSWLKGRYIVLPNVTPNNGHKTLIRRNFQDKYKDCLCVGGYIDGEYAQIEDPRNLGDKNKLLGIDPAWGKKRLALFSTSDSRSSDFQKLGSCGTWIKFSRPTSEAIRQACLAQESRIAQSEPAIPTTWISRIVVSQSKFMGRLDIPLNPQYTALIGGRGTGKSTILDYMRWALCDQPAIGGEEDEVADPRVRQRKLVDATLKPLGAHVEVHCVINGIEHVVRRNAGDGSVLLKVGNEEFQKVRESVIQSLLPIQAYSQKQLSSVAIRTEELLRFVTTPILHKLESIQRKREEVAGRIRENYGTLQRFRLLTSEKVRNDLRIRSLAEQAQTLRDTLAGLSEADRKILDSKSAHEEVRTFQHNWSQRLEATQLNVSSWAKGLSSSLKDLQLPATIPDGLSAEATAYFEAVRALLAKTSESVSSIDREVQESLSEGNALGKASTALEAGLTAFDATYSGVKARSSAHEAKLVELAKLEEDQRTATNLSNKLAQEISELGDPLEKHVALRKELTEAREERRVSLAKQCSDLAKLSDGLIKAAISASKGFDPVKTKFKGLVSGSNVRSGKTDELFENLAKEHDPSKTWEQVLIELEGLLLMEPDADITSEQTPTLSRLGFQVQDQKRILPRLSTDGWLDLSLVELNDTPEFEYRAKEAEYIPFASASAGQQASALLSTLLAQAGSPLVIDQPEDDLDSATVQQIVAKIWNSKSGRQLVFSSHNANLVVNGDADLVLVCAYKNASDQTAGEVKTKGAIDVAEIRDEITTVMEGGERAFRLRKEKYGF